MSIQSAQSEKKTALENTVILIAMKPFTSTLVVCVALLTGCSMPSSSTAAKTRLVFPDGLVLTGTNRLVTPTCYQPLVDIRWVVNLQGQQLFVDSQLRYEDTLSNIGVNRPSPSSLPSAPP